MDLPLSHDDPVDITTNSQYNGLTTFAHLPYVNCFVDEESDSTPYDIAFLGAPFDTAVTARPGARFGPGGIRLGSRRLGGWSVYTGENAFASWAKLVDCGDAPLTWLDNTVALKQLDLAHKVVSSRRTNDTRAGKTPRIIALGGDHTTTLSALRSTYDHWGPGLIRNTSIHVGIRAPVVRPKGDIRNDLRCGFEIIKARDLDSLGVSGVVEQIKERVGNSKVYISVDIDVLDPAYAPDKID
ncbi:hypothetical protein ATERTT37_002206 [Aspergillus terreus]